MARAKKRKPSSRFKLVVLLLVVFASAYFIANIFSSSSSRAATLDPKEDASDMPDSPGPVDQISPQDFQNYNRLLGDYQTAYQKKYPVPNLPFNFNNSPISKTNPLYDLKPSNSLKLSFQQYTNFVDRVIAADPSRGYATPAAYETYFKRWYTAIALHDEYWQLVVQNVEPKWCRHNTMNITSDGIQDGHYYQLSLDTPYFFVGKDQECGDDATLLTTLRGRTAPRVTPPSGTTPTLPTNSTAVSPFLNTGGLDAPGPDIQAPLPTSAGTVITKDPPWINSANLLCFAFKNLKSCKAILGINEARQAYIDYLYTKAKNGSAWYKVAYTIMSKVLDREGTYFENEEGMRVKVAAEAISAFLKAQTSGTPWKDPTVKAAQDKGVIKPNRRGYPEYVPYHTDLYTPIYYYRCGPFDLVGTLKDIEQECTSSPTIKRDSDGLDTFSYKFDASKALPVDMQAVNRTKFEDGVPPYIVKFGSYVYADDDARIAVLTYPWFIGNSYQSTEEVGVDGQKQNVTTTKSITYNDPLRDGGHYYDYLGEGDSVSRTLITTKPYTGEMSQDSPYINRHVEILSSDNRDVPPNTLSLEWIRFGGNMVRQVQTVKVTEDLADHPPTLYARDGDVIRYYVPKSVVAEIVSQPLSGHINRLEGYQEDLKNLKVPAAGSWGITFAPVAGRLNNSNNSPTPVYRVGGITIESYGQEYDYEVAFGDDLVTPPDSSHPSPLRYPIHRVRYRIQASGNTGSSFFSNPDLFNNANGNYGYILQEVSYRPEVQCPPTSIPTNAGVLHKRVCLPRQLPGTN